MNFKDEIPYSQKSNNSFLSGLLEFTQYKLGNKPNFTEWKVLNLGKLKGNFNPNIFCDVLLSLSHADFPKLLRRIVRFLFPDISSRIFPQNQAAAGRPDATGKAGHKLYFSSVILISSCSNTTSYCVCLPNFLFNTGWWLVPAPVVPLSVLLAASRGQCTQVNPR